MQSPYWGDLIVKRCTLAIPSRWMELSFRRNGLNFLLEALTALRQVTGMNEIVEVIERPIKPAALRGFLGRCPNCGKGQLLQGYLKIRDTCPNCGQELFHHRADDGPAYLTILLVGHLFAPTILFVYAKFRPEPTTMILFFVTGVVALSLLLLPRFKGMIVGIQWAKHMHGFGVK
jgi:uncharacterized protein (DUF983 family)